MRQLQLIDKNSSFKLTSQELDSLIKQPQAALSLRINLILIGITWILLGIFYHFLPPQLPLLFSRPWGEDQLINKSFLFLVPGLVTILLIINTRIASIVINRDKLLALIFLWTQNICSLISLLILLRIILLFA